MLNTTRCKSKILHDFLPLLINSTHHISLVLASRNMFKSIMLTSSNLILILYPQLLDLLELFLLERGDLDLDFFLDRDRDLFLLSLDREDDLLSFDRECLLLEVDLRPLDLDLRPLELLLLERDLLLRDLDFFLLECDVFFLDL